MVLDYFSCWHWSLARLFPKGFTGLLCQCSMHEIATAFETSLIHNSSSETVQGAAIGNHYSLMVLSRLFPIPFPPFFRLGLCDRVLF